MKYFFTLFLFILIISRCNSIKQDVVQITIPPDDSKIITEIIQKAIDSCALAGGGTVDFPEGKFLTGGIYLKSKVSLSFDDGAILQGSENFLDYGDGKWTDAIISGDSLENIKITGKGLIDGVDCRNPNGEEGFRGPHAVRLTNCKNITIKGITIKRSANWAINCRFTSYASVEDVTIRGGHDGLHTRFCNNFKVKDCDFRTGDDCFAGNDNQDFTIENCLINTSCNGFRFGCLNLQVKNCRIYGPGEYKHLSQNRNNMLSAFVHFSPKDENPKIISGNWHIKDVTVENVDNVYVYNFRDGLWQTGQPATDIHFENLKASKINKAFTIVGDSMRRLNLTIDNATFSDRDVSNKKKITFEGSELETPALFNISEFGMLKMKNVTFSLSGQYPAIMCFSGDMVNLNDFIYFPEINPNPIILSEIDETSIDEVK